MKLTERVWEYSRKKAQGFTIDLKTMEQPTEGFCVAYIETQDSHSRESLTRVINHALSHDGFVGGWLNEEDGRYYFDSVRVFPEEQKQEAIAFARANRQIAIFGLRKQEQIIIE